MDSSLQILEVFKSDSVLSLNEFKIIDKDNYQILIVSNTGAWATVANTNMDLISTMCAPKTISELKGIGNQDRINEVLDHLFYSGILKINGKDISMIKNEQESSSDNTPSLLILKYTNACNLKCEYCYYYDTHFNINEKLPNNYVYKMVDLLAGFDGNRPCICFHGGEPLLRFNDIKTLVSTKKLDDLYLNV